MKFYKGMIAGISKLAAPASNMTLPKVPTMKQQMRAITAANRQLNEQSYLMGKIPPGPAGTVNPRAFGQ